MKRRFPLLLTLAACLSLSTAALADTIYLKNGQKFEGKVIVKGDQIILVSESGSRLPFPKDRVDRVVRGPAPWELYAQKAATVKAGDVAGHFELAKWCRARKLHKRAAEHFGAVIKASPDHEEAHRLLGHEKVGGAWLGREDALKAKGYVNVKGKWLSPEEYARYQQKNRGKEAAEKELNRLRQLADPDATKAKAARDFYTGRGKKAIQNLIWGLMNLKQSKARLECIKLVNGLKLTRKVHSLWLVQAAIKESNTACIQEICKGIKSRDDTVAMTYLVLYAAGGGNNRRKAAYCLRLVHDKRAYQALVGCIARAPKNTLPGQSGMSLNQMGNYARSSRTGGGLSMGGGEVVPAADSMEFISGKSYKNNVAKWLKWIESLDKAPGGAVIDAGK